LSTGKFLLVAFVARVTSGEGRIRGNFSFNKTIHRKGGFDMEKVRVGILVGSARKNAFSQLIADTIMKQLPDEFEVKQVKIDNLIMFNQDYDDNNETPKEYADFREEVKNCDAYLFVTPEYNRSMPPLLKNALDIASRPAGQSVWGGKPGAIISVSPGVMGGFGSNNHIRQVLMFLDIRTMQQPERYIGNISECVDEHGKLLLATEKFIHTFTDSYVKWVKNFY
jgi:chromate reductase